MPPEEPEKGDKVSWNWGAGAPGGTVSEVKHEGQVEVTSKRGNKIKKNATPDNPGVAISRSGNDVVKRASELNVEEKASGGSSAGEKRKAEDEPEAEKAEDKKEETKEDGPHVVNKQGKEVKPGGKNLNKKEMAEKKAPASKKAKTDEKHAEEEKAEEKKEDKKVEEKKEETANGEKKKAGRPPKAAAEKKSAGAAKEKKTKDAKPRAENTVSSRTRSSAK